MITEVSVERLASQASNDPFEGVGFLWSLREPITRDEIDQRIFCGLLEAMPYSPYELQPREYHLRRIAWLVVHGWDDPIQVWTYELQVGIDDGFHRVAAALFRGDEAIQVTIPEPVCLESLGRVLP